MKNYLFKLILIVSILIVCLFMKLFNIYDEFKSYLFVSHNGFEVNGTSIVKYNNEGGNVVIPDVIDGVVITEIGDYAFEGLNIDSVILPDTIVRIGDYAFANNNIKFLDIPASVLEIGEGAFIHNDIEKLDISDVVSLGNACFNDNNLNSGFFFYNDSKLVSYGGHVKGNVVLPNNISIIGEKAFFETYIVSISIPKSVIVIEDEAFKNNYLVELYLSNNVTTIGNDAFVGNDYLSEVIIDNKVNSILNYPWGADESNLFWLKK